MYAKLSDVFKHIHSFIKKCWYGILRIFYGHVLNPLWLPQRQRHIRRITAYSRLIENYVADIPVHIPDIKHQNQDQPIRIFTIWLQGIESAPQIVLSCWNSIRRHSGLELIVLDEKTLNDWISLPDFIMEQWNSGTMRPAHFTDICRVELLWHYGGIWMDATDYMTHPFPQFILNQSFFMYLSGDDEAGSYPFVQNCFIRSQSHNLLLGAWRDCIFQYWKREKKAIDYFIHQQLFYHIVRNNRQVKSLFDKMPHIHHECTHIIWYRGYRDKPFDSQLFQRLTQEGAFQKTNYIYSGKKKPIPGSFADYIIKFQSG